MMEMKFSQLLEDKYLEWRRKSGTPKTQNEFAKWLDIPPSTVSTWKAEKSTPDDVTIIRKLAAKLGMEVYDVLGIKRPDFRLMFINENWDNAPEELQNSTYEQMEKGVAQNDNKRVHSKQKKERTQ